MTVLLDEVVEEHNRAHPELTLGINPVQDGRVVVDVAGRLDLDSSAQIRSIFDTIITALPSGGHLAVDLGRVYYISSTGVGMLISLLIQTMKQSKSFSVVHPQPQVLKIIELLGFSKFMNIEVPHVRI